VVKHRDAEAAPLGQNGRSTYVRLQPTSAGSGAERSSCANSGFEDAMMAANIGGYGEASCFVYAILGRAIAPV
jgi:hypothetical protein